MNWKLKLLLVLILSIPTFFGWMKKRWRVSPGQGASRFNALGINFLDNKKIIFSLARMVKEEPMVLALDAPEGTNEAGNASSFGMVGVTRHPGDHERVAVRFVREWKAPVGGILDFKAEDGPEWWVRHLSQDFNVVQVAYDAYNLHSMITELNKLNIAWFNKFPQTSKRLESDKQLLDLILQRRITHKGDEALREHIKNANRKLADDGKRLRIVKREPGLNVDLAVCLSMASYECLRLNI